MTFLKCKRDDYRWQQEVCNSQHLSTQRNSGLTETALTSRRIYLKLGVQTSVTPVHYSALPKSQSMLLPSSEQGPKL